MSSDMEPVGFHYGNVARSTRADMQPIPHSITSSARVSMVGGTSTPIAFKVRPASTLLIVICPNVTARRLAEVAWLLRSEETSQSNRHASGQPLPRDRRSWPQESPRPS